MSLSASGPQGAGLWASLKTLLSSLLGILQTRLELLAVEFEEAQIRFFRLLVVTVMGLFLLCMGLLLSVLLLAALFWDTHRLLVLGVLTLVFLGAGAGAIFWARRELRRIPRFLESSRNELSRDRESLAPGS